MILGIEDISKSFGSLKALDSVTMELENGAIVGLIGPNGSGKTTLFNIITGVFHADSGKVMLDGQDITHDSPDKIVKMGIARTFQIPKPFASLSVLQNVAIGATYGKGAYKDKLRAESKAREVLSFAGLSGREGTQANDLTLAELRRLEMARALATEPSVLLLDEVMAGLNPSEVGKAIELIQKTRSELGTTILVVEHVMQAIMTLSDTVIVLNHGIKLAEGAPSEIAHNRSVIEAYLGEEYVVS